MMKTHSIVTLLLHFTIIYPLDVNFNDTHMLKIVSFGVVCTFHPNFSQLCI